MSMLINNYDPINLPDSSVQLPICSKADSKCLLFLLLLFSFVLGVKPTQTFFTEQVVQIIPKKEQVLQIYEGYMHGQNLTFWRVKWRVQIFSTLIYS